MKQILIYSLLSFICFSEINAQWDYPTIKEYESQLQALHKKHTQITTLDRIATSPGNHPVYALTLGKNTEFKPGIAIVAGVDGRHPAGVYMSLQIAEKLLDNHKDLLETRSFYIFPMVNPDAYAQLHASLKYERHGNARETDKDRDGKVSEDPYDDLDGDGFITQVRVLDPTGNMTTHKEDPRILVALKSRDGESPIYRVISEGIDNDKDGQFNEDGPGGIHLNMNFPFQYPAFENGAGEHAMSESENRALADFLFDRWNIHTVLSFALENNINDPDKYDKNKQSKRIKTGPFEKDGTINERIAEWYKKVPGTSNHIPLAAEKGSFSTWAYFHYGRFSYVTPGWWAPQLELKQDSLSIKDDKRKKDASSKDSNYDQRYMKWADSMGIKDYFVDWKSYNHPDFPGLAAEIGGFKPYVRHNPPKTHLDSTIINHLAFVVQLSDNMPSLSFQEVKTENLDNNTFRITGKIVNTGMLPTHTELGDKTRWVRKLRNRIIMDKGQTLLLGNDKTFHDSLQPGESISFSWLVNGKGKISLEAGSPMVGLITHSLDLK